MVLRLCSLFVGTLLFFTFSFTSSLKQYPLQSSLLRIDIDGTSICLEPFSYRELGNGRIEIDPRWVSENIIEVDVGISLPLPGGGSISKIKVHKKVASYFIKAFKIIKENNLLNKIKTFDGTFNPRHMNWDPSKPLSFHSWGIAIDLNASENPLGGPASDANKELWEKAFKPAGFRWLGPVYDPMHFELPAKFVTSCYETITTASILVMDVSGSMSWPWHGGIKIESAKKAALQYIEHVANEPRPAGATHYIGVVTFSDSASVACPLTSDYAEAKKTVISLGTLASTNLGAGLDTALQELGKLPAGSKKFIILLSDGMTNTGKSRESILQTSVAEARRQGICIHTVGFGDPGDIDEDFLKKIAIQSGCGSYNYASSGFELFTTYVKVRHATLGSNRIVEYKTTTPAYLFPGESITLGAFQLTAPAQELHYTVAWSGPVVLQAKLVDPQGRVVDARYPNSVIYSGNGFSHVTVFSPTPGIWRAAATVKSAVMKPAEYYGVASARTGGYVIPYIPPPCLVQVDNTCVIPMPDLPTVVVVAIGITVWIWWLYNQFIK